MEWEILHQVSHPLIVKGHQKLEDQENSYIVLDKIDGTDLFHLMRKRRLRPPEINFVVSQVVLVLQYLHSRNIAFRDIKPENIMVERTGYIKLIDFGLSKQLTKQRTYSFCGSPEYMAPEVIRKEGHSLSVDWWGLGVLIYELYCG